MLTSSHIIRHSISRRAVLGGIAASVMAGRARAEIVDLVAVGKDGWLFPIWDEVRHLDLKRIQPVADICNQAVGILKKANIQVAIVLTPVKSRVYSDFLPNDFKFSADPLKRYAVALEALRSPGTLVPDLLAPLMALRAAHAPDPLFFKGDTHWSAAGSEAAATEFARQAREKIRLPPSAQPGAQLGPQVMLVQEKNDLADLLPAADRAKYPLESYRIHRLVAAQGAGALVEDDAADVVVIGNSFMQPRLGFSQMLSNQLNRPVSLFWKVHQYGPYQTMLAYFASDAFHRRRPNLIVWNFHETDMTVPSDKRDGWGQNVIAPQAFLAAVRQAVGG